MLVVRGLCSLTKERAGITNQDLDNETSNITFYGFQYTGDSYTSSGITIKEYSQLTTIDH